MIFSIISQMKIRLQGNSIRYRLKEPEVKAFNVNGRLTEIIQFGNTHDKQLCFVLQRSSNTEVTVSYEAATTIVYVPEQLARQWTETTLVGFDAVVEIGNGKTLKILVEKDFACLDANEEENAGSYPNPSQQC